MDGESILGLYQELVAAWLYPLSSEAPSEESLCENEERLKAIRVSLQQLQEVVPE